MNIKFITAVYICASMLSPLSGLFAAERERFSGNGGFDINVYYGQPYTSKMTLDRDNSDDVITDIDGHTYGFSCHLFIGSNGFIRGGVGMIFEKNDLEYDYRGRKSDLEVLTHGIDFFVQIDVIKQVSPYLRFGFTMKDRVVYDFTDASGSTSELDKTAHSNFYAFGLGVNIRPFLMVFAEYCKKDINWGGNWFSEYENKFFSRNINAGIRLTVDSNTF